MDGHRLAEFLSLPVNPDEVWQGGVAKLAELMDLPPDQTPSGAGVILWRSARSELVHANPLFPDGGSPLDQFVDAMLELSEEHDFPFRPARIDCNDRQLVDELSRQFEGSGTVVHFRAKMGEWKALLRDGGSFWPQRSGRSCGTRRRSSDRATGDSGDSGSLIVDEQLRAVGLLFAGGDVGGSNGKGLTYANPIDAVLDALKVDLEI